LTPDQVVAELRTGAGAQWDARIVDAVLHLIDSGELHLSAEGMRLLERTTGVA